MLDLRELAPTHDESFETDLPKAGPDWLIESTRHRKEIVRFDGGKVTLPHYESGRLVGYLRDTIRDERGSLQPISARLATAAAHYTAGEDALGDALTDLCVVGRESLAQLGARRIEDAIHLHWPQIMADASRASVLPGLRVHRARAGCSPLPTASLVSLGRVEARAKHVLKHLNGTPLERRSLDLGWIAVSGEDDLPHRPVNVGVTRFRQANLALNVWGLDLDVRYAVAGQLSSTSKNVLLLHGHSSRLEEVEHVAAQLLERGYTVISLDLPGCGYSTPLDHQQVLFSELPQRSAILLPYALEPQLVSRHSSLYTLRFLICALRAFVTRLFETANLDARIDLVAGGSLGGNLALLLSELAPHGNATRHGWVDPQLSFVGKIASWSPASLWRMPGIAHGLPHGRSQELETSDRRRDQFSRWMNIDHVPFVTIRQAEQWYRPGWGGKAKSIAEGWVSRHETYSPRFRTWHWILAHEQVKFSHQHEVLRPDGTGSGKRGYELAGGELLLMGGAGDNFQNTAIYDHVARLGPKIPAAGHALLWHDTGHSIHDERPEQLASVLDDFVRT